MTLYDSILDNVTKEAKAGLREAALKDGLMFLTYFLKGGKGIAAEAAKHRLLLDTAAELGRREISEGELTGLVAAVASQERSILTNTIVDTDAMTARKAYLKGYFELYQQLLNQEGKPDTRVAAIKMRFESEQAYRSAIQPILDAEKRESEIVRGLYPQMRHLIDVLLEVNNRRNEAEIRKIFTNAM